MLRVVLCTHTHDFELRHKNYDFYNKNAIKFEFLLFPYSLEGFNYDM